MESKQLENTVTLLLQLNKSERKIVFNVFHQLYKAEQNGINLNLRQKLADKYFNGGK